MINGVSDPTPLPERKAPFDPFPNPFLVVAAVPQRNFRILPSAEPQPAPALDVNRDKHALRSDRAPTGAWTSAPAVSAPELDRPLVAEVADPGEQGPPAGDTVREPPTERRHWSRPPRLDLAADMTVAESFARIVLDSLSHLTANHECARRNLHIEGVHQCRVALRRLRSAFQIYRPLLCRERIAPIEDTVRWLGGILGTARDLDVFQAELLEPAVAALGRSQSLAVLTASLEGRKAAAYAAVGDALTSARYGDLLMALRELAPADDAGRPGTNDASLDQPLVQLAATALSRAHQKLLRRGSGFEILSPAERHDVRIALKRLRYALDFFAGLFDGGSKKRFTRRVARLQDALGRMNDIAAADTMLAQLVGIAADGCESVAPVAPKGLAYAAGSILGWHRRGAADIDRRLVEDWYEFVRAKPFWLREQNAAA